MIPTWQTDDGCAQLHLADARELLPEFRDGAFDCVIADIPYNEVNRESSGLRNLDKGDADLETFDLQFAVDQSCRLAKTVYLFCGVGQISELRTGFVAKGFTTRLCCWEKTNPSPMNGEYLWLSSVEACVFARTSGAWFSENCASPIWRGPTARNQRHPAQKPTWLMELLIKASVPVGGIVLDFCAGSGTTGKAALRTGRRFVGIESNQEWYKLAVERVGGLTPLFREPIPVQKELFDYDPRSD